MEGQFLNRLFWGILLIAAGVIFLLSQTGHIEFDVGSFISTFWPCILILIGLKSIISHGRYGSWGGSVWGLIMILIGFVFLGNNLGLDVSIRDFFQYLGPLILIVFGIKMIFKPSSRHRDKYRDKYKEKFKEKYESKYKNKWDQHTEDFNPVGPPPPPPPFPSDNPDDASASQMTNNTPSTAVPTVVPVDEGKQGSYGKEYKQKQREHWGDSWGHGWGNAENRSTFIGDIHLGRDYWELKSMNISSFIGDTILDLTKAQIPYGQTKFNISTFIGDVKVFVPNDMNVEVRVVSSSFLGDIKVFDRIEKGFMKSVSVETPQYVDAEKKIVIHASMFIGDVKVQRIG